MQKNRAKSRAENQQEEKVANDIASKDGSIHQWRKPLGVGYTVAYEI